MNLQGHGSNFNWNLRDNKKAATWNSMNNNDMGQQLKSI